MFDLILGLNRWIYRTIIYTALMRDEYPPFRLDQGPRGTGSGRRRRGLPQPASIMTWLAGLFLLAHGLVHLGIWCTPFDPVKAPFNPRHSWFAVRVGREAGLVLAVVLAVAAAAVFLRRR